MIHHRTPEFSRIIAELKEDLKYLFQTKEGEVYTFCSSGTGAMEACVANLLKRKSRALVILGGKFGERWAELCEAYGVEILCIPVEYGKVVKPQAVEDALQKNKDIKAVFATHCETSTGVLHDIESIARITKKHSVLLVVDAITGIGIHPFLMDTWGVDVAVTGSQKGCMIPPGLALLAVRPTAWRTIEESDLPRYYWDLRKMRDTLKKDTTPFTPAISLIRALKVAVDMMKQEGLENIWQRHARMAQATREGVKALGLELFSESPSNIVTAIKSPKGLDCGAFLKKLRTEYGIWFAEGQDEMKGKIFRIAHVGYMNEFDILTAISVVERGLYEASFPVEIGKGVAAAQNCLLKAEIPKEAKKKPIPAPL